MGILTVQRMEQLRAHIYPGETSVQDGNGMATLVESLVEGTEPSSTKTAELRSLRRLHEKSPKSPLLGGTWEGTGAPTFRLAGKVPDVIFPLSMEHMHAASDDLTRSRTAAPPENPDVHCKDISLASRAWQVDETTLSTSDASPGDYMDFEPITSEYDVASRSPQ
jgi:hypothetical protein